MQPHPLFSGLGAKRGFHIAYRALFQKLIEKSGAVFRFSPNFQIEGRLANNLLAPISAGAKETLVYVDIAALRQGADGNRLRTGVERLMEFLLRALALGNVMADPH